MSECESQRNSIIKRVQKKADTSGKQIDAAIVSRVASLVLDEVARIIGRKCK